MKISKTAAIKRARAESSMHRQGSGWVVVTYEPERRVWHESSETPFFLARTHLTEWRAFRAAELASETAS